MIKAQPIHFLKLLYLDLKCPCVLYLSQGIPKAAQTLLALEMMDLSPSQLQFIDDLYASVRKDELMRGDRALTIE